MGILMGYLAPANRAGKYLRGKTVGERGGVVGDNQRESGWNEEFESQSVIESDGNRKERLG